MHTTQNETRYALMSVSDKTGLVDFSRALVQQGYTILATSGTKRTLDEHGISALSIEEYTGQKEILDGRVKTLHPKIHGGILAQMSNETHRAQLADQGIYPISIAVVNLYPFTKYLDKDGMTVQQMIELIDIGGPTMIRAAAKNSDHVLPVMDPADYPTVLAELAQGGFSTQLRRRLSAKVFAFCASYNLAIARYLSQQLETTDEGKEFPYYEGVILEREYELRYGENPHQNGSFYRQAFSNGPTWKVLQGKPLSYNNLLDFHAAQKLIRCFCGQQPTAAIFKHLNPCGLSMAGSLVKAVEQAKAGDPRSHFGGILVFNRVVDAKTADLVVRDFAEIVVAPEFTAEALTIFQKKKALRVIQIRLEEVADVSVEMRRVEGGCLLQRADEISLQEAYSVVESAQHVAGPALSDSGRADLALSWVVCAHVSSNAISIVKDGMLLAIGAGQMSRIDSVELALAKARTHGHSLRGSSVASDAFFPFSDNIEVLAEAGVRAIIAPAGAMRDEEVKSAAAERGITLLFTDKRHFRH
jgi:phosphoribosylaminoimidazolecarboxamide formyltransferase / IMP cyclohydrolase